MSDNYVEETKPLFKMLKTEAFRFVIVRYNHFSFVQQLEKDVQRLFPDRPFLKVDALNAAYSDIANAYFSNTRGFLFIENFDDVLKEQLDSQQKETPQYKIDNERRRGITAGLNLRRDKFAKYPIALFVFVPASTGKLYAKIIMEKMPDLWSFRSMILDLEREKSFSHDDPLRNIHISNSDLKTEILQEDDTELQRLLAILDNTPESEIAYRLSLYPQIVNEATETGKYDLAFSILDTWEKNVSENEKAWIWIQKGDILKIFGKLEEALTFFENAKVLAEQNNDKEDTALSYERLGQTHSSLGNLDMALTFFEEMRGLFEELYCSYPNNVAFKNSLAISYSKLGETHSSLGNLDKALTFFEERNKLSKELYSSFPNNVEFKNGLAISYEKLGQTHSRLGNLDKALTFFKDETQLFEEFYSSYPNNVNFKNGLAISYQYLGNTHSSLGNLDKALTFFEEYNRLKKELYSSYPNNVDFKNGLAISYQYLGNTHSSLGNLDKALNFFDEYNRLEKVLYCSYPNNVDFKNNLAISYCKLAEISKEKKDNKKAKTYFQEAEKLWLELVRDAPQYVQFQEFLGIVQEDIKSLEE